MFGFLNVYKPKGKTSHDVVAFLRRVTKIRQIGHTGTLDPFAEGVLPICIGKATRLIEYLSDDKAYTGTIKLGEATTTYDIEGEITHKSDKKISLKEIESILGRFRGEIEQIPPVYSAIKKNGKKLYEYARKGEAVDIEPRKVNISEIKIINFTPDKQELELYISCSKGTYIRSIANDIGNCLGTYGHLIKLVRVKAGNFLIDNAVSLDNLSTYEEVEQRLISPPEYLKYPVFELSEAEFEKISHGMSIKSADMAAEDGIVILTYRNNLSAVGEISCGSIKCKKVFI